MALSKLSRKRRWLIKYLLAEEIEDEEVILQMYGGKRAKIHLMFELRNEEGIFQRDVLQLPPQGSHPPHQKTWEP